MRLLIHPDSDLRTAIGRSMMCLALESQKRTRDWRRKIGRLKNGFEASFLVLNDNPLQDFANVQKIDKRFKQGEFFSW